MRLYRTRKNTLLIYNNIKMQTPKQIKEQYVSQVSSDNDVWNEKNSALMKHTAKILQYLEKLESRLEEKKLIEELKNF